jgi:hypothetical protein
MQVAHELHRHLIMKMPYLQLWEDRRGRNHMISQDNYGYPNRRYAIYFLPSKWIQSLFPERKSISRSSSSTHTILVNYEPPIIWLLHTFSHLTVTLISELNASENVLCNSSTYSYQFIALWRAAACISLHIAICETSNSRMQISLLNIKWKNIVITELE